MKSKGGISNITPPPPHRHPPGTLLLSELTPASQAARAEKIYDMFKAYFDLTSGPIHRKSDSRAYRVVELS